MLKRLTSLRELKKPLKPESAAKLGEFSNPIFLAASKAKRLAFSLTKKKNGSDAGYCRQSEDSRPDYPSHGIGIHDPLHGTRLAGHAV
jgi:hypothetical protein